MHQCAGRDFKKLHIFFLGLAGGELCTCALLSAKLYQKNGDVMLVCKAYNGRVVTQWLSESIAAISDQDHPNHTDDRIAPIALCMFLVPKGYIYIYICRIIMCIKCIHKNKGHIHGFIGEDLSDIEL